MYVKAFVLWDVHTWKSSSMCTLTSIFVSDKNRFMHFQVLLHLQSTPRTLSSSIAIRHSRHRNLSTRRIRKPRSKNLHTILGNKKRVLKLRRLTTIRSNTRPVIGPSLILVRAQRNHRLDSKAHTRLRLADGFVLGVMRDVGCAVEELVNAVAAVSFHDAAVVALRELLDRVAVVAEQRAGFHQFDGFFQAVACGFDDAHAVGVLGGAADVVGFVQVAVEAAVVEGYVDVEDVAVLQGALVGDAVADDFVDGCAD
jgi:hypothetical protein